MTIPEFIEHYGLLGLVVYVAITDLVPKLIETVKWTIVKMSPERIAKIKMIAEEHKRSEDAIIEDRARARDLEERQVIAHEQTAKALILIDAHMVASEKDIKDQLTLLTTGLITANQSLAVLLDRNASRRASDPKEH